MIHYSKDIFDMCSYSSNKALRLFCDALNNSSADVFIIMAHKAVQLFQVLLDQNHLDSHINNKIIISSQSLDFDCSYLVGKKVVIVDDIIISGTSIAATINRLLEVGLQLKDISIITLAKDKDYQTMCFNNNGDSILQCNTILDDAACIELSYFISRMFSYYGIPYDVDFPSYSPFELSETKASVLFNDLMWNVENISNMDQKLGDVDVFVLFPKPVVLELLWKQIGVNLEDCAHFKLRTYIKHYPSGKKVCNIVPMCLFNGITESELDTLYHLCINKDFYPSSFKAKLRYLQFFIAHQMFLLFTALTSVCNSCIPVEKSIRLLFGVNDGSKVIDNLTNHSLKSDKIMKIRNANCVDHELVQKYQNACSKLENSNNLGISIIHEDRKTDLWINRTMMSPFIWWYDTKEIPVRKELMLPVRHFINDYDEIESKLTRLNSGFSLPTLQLMLENKLPNNKLQTIISLFLDRAIDEGIIVPTIYHNEKEQYLCRAYRHGEDLPFAIEDECRLLFFLSELSKKIPSINYSNGFLVSNDGIAEVSFEKIIVLFYQMGIKQGNIFNRFLGFNHTKLLKPFLSLHGKIQGFVDPQEMEKLNIEREHFYSEKDEYGNQYITWLTYWLEDNGFIKKIENKGKNTTRIVYAVRASQIKTYLDQNERNCMSAIIKNQISTISSIISRWYLAMEKNKQKDKFKVDSTALTSCSDAEVFASAIATEIHYFHNYWKKQVETVLCNANDYDEIYELLTHNEDNKKHTFSIQQGLNSGRDKVSWFEEEKALDVVNDVSTLLGDAESSIWMQIWDEVKSGKYTAKAHLKACTEQSIGYLFFYSACYDCLLSREFWELGIKPSNYEKYRTSFNKQRSKCSELLRQNLFVELDSIALLNDFKLKVKNFSTFVTSVLSASEDAVMHIESEVEEEAQNYTIMYMSSLIFDVKAINPSQNDGKVLHVWTELNDPDIKTQLNIVHFPEQLEDVGFARYGLYYGNSKVNKDLNPIESGKILLSLYKKLCEEFSGQAYKIKAILIPHTPVGRMYKHNVRRNIPRYTEEYKNQVIDKLANYYRVDTMQQLLLAMTYSVDPTFFAIVENIGWDCSQITELDSDSGYESVGVYYQKYIKPHSYSLKDATYSVIKIDCGTNYGLGLLLRTNKKIICVSCNHIIKMNSTSNTVIEATSEYETRTNFVLTPLKVISFNDSPEELLPASLELSILEPQWNGKILFDIEHILCLDDFLTNIDNYLNSECQCFGRSNQVNLCWRNGLKIVGAATHGYYQIDDAVKKIESGFSGGIITLVNNQHQIIGIHKGRFSENEFCHMIPCALIKEEIQKLEGE